MYRNSDTSYVIYSSLPLSFGDVVSVLSVDGDTVSNIATFPLNLLDASDLPQSDVCRPQRDLAICPLRH